ncbi:MAG: hypothetical protein M1824_001470 [Vezdaea acicularis]|nr:MAG: hypothetical protein M1824_001470 [Vezdaea acicularis]
MGHVVVQFSHLKGQTKSKLPLKTLWIPTAGVFHGILLRKMTVDEPNSGIVTPCVNNVYERYRVYTQADLDRPNISSLVRKRGLDSSRDQSSRREHFQDSALEEIIQSEPIEKRQKTSPKKPLEKSLETSEVVTGLLAHIRCSLRPERIKDFGFGNDKLGGIDTPIDIPGKAVYFEDFFESVAEQHKSSTQMITWAYRYLAACSYWVGVANQNLSSDTQNLSSDTQEIMAVLKISQEEFQLISNPARQKNHLTI